MTEKTVPSGDNPDGTEHNTSQSQCTSGDLIAKGKAIVESRRPPRGEHLGRIAYWGLGVYQGSPQEWKDALFAEWEASDD